jgi:hypothetical protein
MDRSEFGVSSKQAGSVDKGWLYNLGAGQGFKTPHLKSSIFQNATKLILIK